ncbi:MAG: hypothetical protein KAS75_07165 [Planctomycetes bacterium]|nr:hypothetical protein [Planctomycetota bacterium]
MAKKKGNEDNKGVEQEAEVKASRKIDDTETNRKRGWNDVFDNVTYSDGPGDNIYVFG